MAQRPSRAWVIAVSWAALLALLVCWGATAVEAHPEVRASVVPAVRFEAAPTPVEQAPAPPSQTALTSARVPAPAASSDWMWVALSIVPAMVAALRRLPPRGLALTVALVLAVFACESAIHAVHHLTDPRQAEGCPVFSASQHVTGLTASATPDVPPPAAVSGRPAIHPVQRLSRALDGKQPRAPPACPA